jgi:hypothetical protein
VIGYLRGCWCNIIILNVRAPTDEESDDSGDKFMRTWSRFAIILLETI